MSSTSIKKNYRCVPALQQFYSGGAYAVSSDGTFLVCACDDAIKIVDASNASIKSTIEGDSQNVTALALSPDDKYLFSASHSLQVRVWDLSSLKCVRSWKGHDKLPVMCMASDASGGLLATGGSDGEVRVWDVDGGFCTHYFRVHKGHKGGITCIMFHPDPTMLFLFSGSDDKTVRVWDLHAKECIATLENHNSRVTSIAISEDGLTLLSAGRDKVVNLWDLNDYNYKVTVPTYEVLEAVCVVQSGTPFHSFVDSFKSRSKKKKDSSAIYFVTVGERGIIRIWSSEGAVCLFEQKMSDFTITSDQDDNADKDDSRRGFINATMLPLNQGLLCITADQQFLFYSAVKNPEDILELNLSKRLVGYNEEIVDMKFLGEEEQFLAVATNIEQVRVYDVATMSCFYVLAGHTDIILSLDTCVSSSGKSLVVTGSKDKDVRLWDTESRCCIGVGIGHMGAVGAVAFSKKQRNFFVSGSNDRTLKVWSMDGVSDDEKQSPKLKAKAVVAAHDKDINALAVAPNDSLVCSGSQDRTACVWKLPELVKVTTLKGHKRGVWSVEFSPVDQCVMTSSGDKTIKIWAISDGSCLKTFEGHTSNVLRASFLTRGTQIVSCGGDDLVKLWTVKTNECIATYDHHDDKVWALAIGKKTEMFATGGGDGTVNLWHDSTAYDKEEAFRKEEEQVLKSQELENAVIDANYTKAVQLAFELRRPHKLFELFSELCRKRDAEERIGNVLGALSKDELRLLFEYVREWNTKPKLCHVAHFVLFKVFNMRPPTEIIEVKGIGELLEGLIPYSQRHFSRIDRLVRSTLLLEYTLTKMSVIQPETDTKAALNEKSKTPSDINKVKEEPHLITNSADDIEEEQKEKRSSKKRKSDKVKEAGHKKAKKPAYVDASAISLKA